MAVRHFTRNIHGVDLHLNIYTEVPRYGLGMDLDSSAPLLFEVLLQLRRLWRFRVLTF